jgi:hypothetical protein
MAPIDLFPRSVLEKIATAGAPPATSTGDVVRVPDWRTGHDVDLGGPFSFGPPAREDVEAQRSAWLGPAYAGLTTSVELDPTFDQQIDAASALSMLPAALLGSVAKPAVETVYRILDHVPPELRRPLERSFGLLIDQAMSLSAAAPTPVAGSMIATMYPDGQGLPPSMSLQVQAHSQTEWSCGETAVATILEAAGSPTEVGDVDTQSALFGGTSGLVEEEITRRGLSLVTGPGDLDRLKAFIAHGYPVLVSVGWADGGGHFIVVTGYDDHAGKVTIDNWTAQGGVSQVGYGEFLDDWRRHLCYMTVVVPRRETRLDALRAEGDPRHPDEVFEGLTLSDFYVTQEGKVFVEGAYRYVTHYADVIVRVSFDRSEEELERALDGSFAIQRELASGWVLAVKIDKLSLRGRDDRWSSFSTAPLSVTAALGAPGFQIQVGTQDGGLQASLVADLGRWVAGLGMNVSFSMDADHTWRAYATVAIS